MNLFKWARVSPSAAVTGLALRRAMTLTLVGTIDDYSSSKERTSGKYTLSRETIGCQQSATYCGF